jgi:hypothetical protein
MRKILIAVLVILGMMFAHAPKDENTADRPLFYQGTVKIQLKDDAVSSKAFQVKEFGKTYSVTGIPSIDKIGGQIKASSPRVTHIEAKNKDLAKGLGLDRWITVTIPEDQDVMAAVEMYKADPNVSFAQPEYANYLMATPNDTYFLNNWGHNNTKQLPAYVSGSHSGAGVGTIGFDANTKAGWDGTQAYGNSSIIIAIMDTGIDIDHPDLVAHYVGGYDFAMSDTNPDDNEGVLNVSGHGTSCAGVAAGVINNGIGVSGVAGNCSVMALKILNSSGSLVGMANAAIWGADNGADIISMSFGGDYQYGTDATADAAYTYAYNAGVTLLAATGNDESLSRISYPANHPNIIGVGAAAPDNGRKSTTSVDGETWWASQWCTVVKDDRAAVDIIAPTILPATDIVGSGGFDAGDYGLYFNGTSCATPYAAGFAGLIKSHYPSYTPTQVRQLMVDTAMDIVDEESTAGWDGKTGYGLIDIEAALGYVPTAPPSTPTLASPSNGTATTDPTPRFDWSDDVDAATFTILVDNNSNFGSPEINQTVTISEYTAVSNLAEGTYYWKVLGTNIIGSSSYSTTWTVTVAFPDINLSVSTLNTSAAPGASVGSSFGLGNTSSAIALNYTGMNISYTGALVPGGTYISNDFTTFPGTGWTNTGWVANAGAARATGSGATCTLTSPAANTSAAGAPVYLDFTQSFVFKTGSWTRVEYYTGSAWVQIYYATAATTAAQHIALPIKSANTQVRFTAYTTRSAGSTATWDIDNIVVSSAATPYTWLTINSSTSGTVAPSGSSTINVTCNATGLIAGTYNADITIACDDPDESAKVLPVVFTVETIGAPPASPTLASPTNAATLFILKPVFDWNDVSGATSYTILVDNNATFASPEVTNSPAVSTYTPAADLALGTYYWKVLSTNAFGSSTYSATWTVTLAPLTAPINVLTSVVGTNLTVSWNAVGGATSYDVYSSADPYGTYTFVSNVATNSYVTTTASSKLFWYIKAKN